ncbi:MAG: hypothetical protein WCK49_02365 [Myxococcaceae bacterium]
MHRLAYEDERAIIIPLSDHGRRIEVNVDAFKDQEIILKPRGSSQTEQILPYHLENAEYNITFWDTPGFMDTRGNMADARHRDLLAEFLTKTPIHAVAFVLTKSDVVRDSERYQDGVDMIRRLLPKSFLPNIVGVYNNLGLAGPTYQEGCRDSLSKLFDPDIRIPTYFIDGSALFNDSSKLKPHEKIYASEFWAKDRKAVEKLLLQTKNDRVLNLEEVKKIQELQREIYDAVDGMNQYFRLLEFQKSNLKLLEAKKTDSSEKIKLCKVEIQNLETERTRKIKKLSAWQNELIQLAMKAGSTDAYVWYLSNLLSPLKDDFSVSREEYASQKQLCQDWTQTYKELDMLGTR